jgi:hypothetical protein
MKRRGQVDTLITRQHGAAVPDRSDGRSGLLVATRAIHPTSETGRAASMCDWKSYVDDTRGCHCTSSQAGPTSVPEAN